MEVSYRKECLKGPKLDMKKVSSVFPLLYLLGFSLIQGQKSLFNFICFDLKLKRFISISFLDN